jgi:myosin V
VPQENQDLLIKCVSQDLGFSSGRPIAACLIYMCLLHWRSFEVERTSVYDCIIQTIGTAIEVIVPNSDLLVKLTVKLYWLLNCGSLFHVELHFTFV